MEKDNQTKTEELLCETYRNLRMGCENLCSVTPKITDRFMLKDVTSQLDRYASLSRKCSDIMRNMSVTPKEPSKKKKLMSRGAIMVNTMFDGSDAHIAEMIVRGTDMGADALERQVNDCKSCGCPSEAVDFCESVVEFERYASGKMMDYM